MKMNRILALQPDNYNSFAAALIKILQLTINVYNKFSRDAGFARAGGLAYSTIMAAIPFAAVVISMLGIFGVFQNVQDQVMDFVLRMLIPTKQDQAKEIVNQFLNNSKTLGVVGLVLFTITSVLLLNTITENMNAMWGSKAGTKFLSKFTTYVSVIIFGSLLLAASTTITSKISFTHIEHLAILNQILLRISPFIFDFFVIMLLIGITPSGRVQMKYLLIVSSMGALFWEIIKYAFFDVSSWAIRTSVIYGALAVIPIFLFWVYIIWTIILISLETAWVMQHKNNNWMGKPFSDMTPAEKLTFGVELFLTVAQEYDSGREGPTSDQLADVFSVSVSDVRYMMELLQKEKFVIQAGENGNLWVPARSLSKIKTRDLINSVFGQSSHEEIKSFIESGREGLHSGSISELIDIEEIKRAEKNPAEQ